MIHEAYMPVYIGSRFSLRKGARAGPPEVVQEALADLKRAEISPNSLSLSASYNKKG